MKQALSPGDRTTWTAWATYRYEHWPEGVWIEGVWIEEGKTYGATVESVHLDPYGGFHGEDTSYALLQLDHGPVVAVDLEDSEP